MVTGCPMALVPAGEAGGHAVLLLIRVARVPVVDDPADGRERYRQLIGDKRWSGLPQHGGYVPMVTPQVFGEVVQLAP